MFQSKTNKRPRARDAQSHITTRRRSIRSGRADGPGAVMARTLSAITEHAQLDFPVRREDLRVGDQVVVRTRNSTYCLWFLGAEGFAVTGGWFEREGRSPETVAINGCTYGHSVIRHDVVAARGLFLEFGNNVLTTRIQDVHVVRSPDTEVCH
ncbi:MAG: hypothetical protein ACE5HU_02805 [Acidobacteriota bacterium]